MQVRMTLMGTFKTQAPDGGVLDLTEGATIDDALAALQIQWTQVQVVLRDGRPQADGNVVLSPGDALTVVPLVGGG